MDLGDGVGPRQLLGLLEGDGDGGLVELGALELRRAGDLGPAEAAGLLAHAAPLGLPVLEGDLLGDVGPLARTLVAVLALVVLAWALARRLRHHGGHLRGAGDGQRWRRESSACLRFV